MERFRRVRFENRSCSPRSPAQDTASFPSQQASDGRAQRDATKQKQVRELICRQGEGWLGVLTFYQRAAVRESSHCALTSTWPCDLEVDECRSSVDHSRSLPPFGAGQPLLLPQAKIHSQRSLSPS